MNNIILLTYTLYYKKLFSQHVIKSLRVLIPGYTIYTSLGNICHIFVILIRINVLLTHVF